MFDSMWNALSPTRRLRARHAPLVQWAESRGLEFLARRDGACAFVGEWSGQPVRVDLQPAARPYLEGWELNASTEIGLSLPSGVVLMNRSLKLSMERWADYVYSQLTNSVQTMADTLPEEVRWLATYRDAGWPGPEPAFFEHFAVLTDSADEARAMIDEAVRQRLMHWPDGARAADTPLLLMRLRGKLQMRLQLEPSRHAGCERHALDLFEHLSRRMLAQAHEVNSRA